MTVAITATAQDVYPPRVLVAVTGLTVGDVIQLFREVDGQRTPVRNGSQPALADTSFVRIDAELPFGVPVSYVAVTNDTENVISNSDFETNTTGWVAGTGSPTIARSTAQHHSGSASMLITPPGAVDTVWVDESVSGTSAHPVTAGRSYSVQLWAYSPNGWDDVRPAVDWYDSSGTFLDSGIESFTVPAATWTLLSQAYTAPDGAAYCAASVGMGGTPAATDTLYVDEFHLLDSADAGTVEYSTDATTYTLPGGKVALSDAISGLAAEVVITAWPDKPRTRQASTFVAGGRNVAVLGGLVGFSGSLDVYVESTSAVGNVTALLEGATSGVVQIRQPGGYDGIDSHVAVLGVTEHRFSQDGSDERRTITLDVLQVDGWADNLEARGFTYADAETAYDGLSYADAEGNFATYLDAELADWSS